jgi:hypothetical protein
VSNLLNPPSIQKPRVCEAASKRDCLSTYNLAMGVSFVTKSVQKSFPETRIAPAWGYVFNLISK